MIRILVPVAVFTGGAAVMVVELLGVRLIAPVYGTGLHVWASLISVALAALSIGYFIGGRIADRRPEPRLFFALILLAGLGVAAIPLYAPILILTFESWGIRLGALVAATVTFLPPLFFLGCVSPFAIRISAAALKVVGKTAGRLYAISTLGSVAGTLATGFFLGPILEIDLTLRLAGGATAALGVLGLLAAGRRASAAAGAILVGGLVIVPAPLASATPGLLRFRADTPYQRVEVVDKEGERWLLLDGCVQTRRMETETIGDWWGYAQLFSLLPGFRSDAESLLVLGLGGGAVLPLLSGEEYAVTAVEIDPVVVRAAREWFGTFEGTEEVHVADARTFVRRAGREWDLVALDVCSSDRMPEHLSTVEFFREIKAVLAADGVVAMNSIGHREGPALASFRLTLAAAFRNVVAFATVPEGPITNVVFFASDGPLELSWVFEDDFENCRIELSGGTVLTDRWNPVNYWNAPWALEIRRTRGSRY